MVEDYIKRVDWDEVGHYLNSIAERVDPHDFSGVYGVPRGGSVLGAWLAHKLYLPMLSKLQPNCIIVDDICDGGGALRYLLSELTEREINNCFITVMFYRTESNLKLDYFYKEKDDNWIVFPWEQ